MDLLCETQGSFFTTPHAAHRSRPKSCSSNPERTNSRTPLPRPVVVASAGRSRAKARAAQLLQVALNDLQEQGPTRPPVRTSAVRPIVTSPLRPVLEPQAVKPTMILASPRSSRFKHIGRHAPIPAAAVVDRCSRCETLKTNQSGAAQCEQPSAAAYESWRGVRRVPDAARCAETVCRLSGRDLSLHVPPRRGARSRLTSYRIS